MIPAELLPNEEERLAELLRYELIDSERESDFDDIVNLASTLCQSEIALISLIDDCKQWFKAKKGLDADETPRDIAFCTHAIHQDEIFEICDATKDDRFYDNPLVTGHPYIRFYAGQPINSARGYKLGTLCLIDNYPRKLTETERYTLKILARQVERRIELRLKIKELQQSLQLIDQQKEALKSTNILQDQVLSVLAHDLRNPLASLQQLLELIDYDAIEVEDMQSIIKEIRPNLNQSISQLEDVLNWGKEQIESKQINWQIFSVDAIAKKCLNWVKNNAKQKGIILTKKIAPDIKVFGDKNLVEIILRNLLVNAIKFSHKSNKVALFAYQKLDRVCIGVKDNGVGISPEKVNKILHGHERCSSLGTAREKGTGLGLILCQTYLTKMNTKLNVVSKENKGCTFYFILPEGKI